MENYDNKIILSQATDQERVAFYKKTYAHVVQNLPPNQNKDTGYIQITFIPTESPNKHQSSYQTTLCLTGWVTARAENCAMRGAQDQPRIILSHL